MTDQERYFNRMDNPSNELKGCIREEFEEYGLPSEEDITKAMEEEMARNNTRSSDIV